MAVIYIKNDVGIGTTTPEYTLDVQNTKPGIRIKAISSTRDAGNAYLVLDKLKRSKQASIIYRTFGDTRFHTGLLGTDNYSISTSALDFNGLQVKSTGYVEISDELHTTKTGDVNMVPIAYGKVVASKMAVSPGNVTVNNTDTGVYYITIEGESCEDCSTSVTCLSTYAFAHVGVDSDSGKMIVLTHDLKSDDLRRVNKNFSFIIYKP